MFSWKTGVRWRRTSSIAPPGAAAAAAPSTPGSAGPPVNVGADAMAWADAGSHDELSLAESSPPPSRVVPRIFVHSPSPSPPRADDASPLADADDADDAASCRSRSCSVCSVCSSRSSRSPSPQPRSRPQPQLLLPRLQRFGISSSLPNMDSPDLQLTPDSSQLGGDMSDGSFTDVEGGGGGEEDEEENDDGDEDEDDEPRVVKIPLRSARRKSVMPPSLKINDIDFLDVPENSPGNSITSINSIASLLKEKLALTLPAVVKKQPRKRSREFKLHAFVGFLFICIVSLVGFAYVYYHQQVLQRAYFKQIRFNNKERIVKIFNDKDIEVMYGSLGENLGQDPAYSCLSRDQKDGMACMEWMHKARLYMGYKEGGGRCYTMLWESLSEGVLPTDCYDWSADHGHWYGGGQTSSMKWPVEEGRVEMAPFVTGDAGKHQWGNVVKRYFINSNGVILYVDPKTPLYVSLKAGKSKKFCLQAKHDSFSYMYHLWPLPKLNYTICTSSNMTALHSHHIAEPSAMNLSTEDRGVIEKLMVEPVWHIAPFNSSELTEINIFNYSEDVLKYKFLKHGHILINELWQKNIGDFSLDADRFPKMNETIDILHRKGFRIVFSVQPFISTESFNFREAVGQELLVHQRGPQHYIPALTRYKSLRSAGVIDVTKAASVPWLQKKLTFLVENYGIDSVYVDIGTAYDMPHYYEFENQLSNPDEYKTIFMKSISPKVHVFGISSAITRPHGPVFVSLPPCPSTWESLQSIIATVLTYGIIGFPLVLPGPIGGNFVSIQSNSSSNSTDPDNILPEKELYLRWMQLSAFLPAMSYSHLPQKYEDKKVLDLAESISNLRQTTINPIVKKYLEAGGPLDSGLPFNRPLWMLDPADPVCHTVVDEFAVGEDIIVAPVIKKGAREREVYLPNGVWTDGIDGSIRKGNRYLHHYKVDEDKIAYFVRKTSDDEARF